MLCLPARKKSFCVIILIPLLTILYTYHLPILKNVRYVRLQYRPISSLEKIQSSLISETLDTENNDFVELLMYSKNDGVLMTGKMTDGNQSMVINYILPFYLHTYDILYISLFIII